MLVTNIDLHFAITHGLPGVGIRARRYLWQVSNVHTGKLNRLFICGYLYSTLRI